jgi:hypothetical protein
MIEEQYRVNLLLDNLPVAMPLFVETEGSAESAQKVYETGCLAPPLRDRIVSGGWTPTCYSCQRDEHVTVTASTPRACARARPRGG